MPNYGVITFFVKEISVTEFNLLKKLSVSKIKMQPEKLFQCSAALLDQ